MKSNLLENKSIGDFYLEITRQFYPETQEGLNLLADDINSRIDPRIDVSLAWYRDTKIIKAIYNYSASDSASRSYSCVFRHSTMYSSIARILDVLAAFACGIGYEVVL